MHLTRRQVWGEPIDTEGSVLGGRAGSLPSYSDFFKLSMLGRHGKRAQRCATLVGLPLLVIANLSGVERCLN